MIYIFLSVLVVFITGYIITSCKKPIKFPPGPKWYPFVGSTKIVLSMAKKYRSQWKGLSQLAKEYSTQVLGLKLGSEMVVVVYGEKNIKQVFTDKTFEGRPNTFFWRLRCFGKRMGITSTDGPLWRELRQFTVKQLKIVGFGKSVMEKEIQDTTQRVVESIKDSNYKCIILKEILASAVMNVLWKYVAGEQIKEERLKYIINLFNARSKAFSMAGGWLNQLPWTRFLLPNVTGYSLIKRLNQEISNIIEDAIEKHKRNLIEGEDFMYLFLRQIKRSTDATYSDEQLKIISLDLLIGGSQTTSNVLQFAFLEVLRNSDEQKKICNEIDLVLEGVQPCYADSSRLLYTTAFLLEVQRLYTVAPFVGPRRVLSDTYINGYLIPKHTTVLISVGDLNCDPEVWADPEVFRPERFIDQMGNLINTEHIFSFGQGRRKCPAESLARSFIFIMFVGVMQKFNIECSNGALPSNEPVIGLVASPQPYRANFVPRCST